MTILYWEYLRFTIQSFVAAEEDNTLTNLFESYVRILDNQCQ